MKKARLRNVLIRDLMVILNRLSMQYDMVDIIICPDEGKIIIDPVEKLDNDSELTDENIYTLI